MAEESYGTLWVCVCCIHSYANGLCCEREDAHKRARDERGRFIGGGVTVLGDGIPLSAITKGFHVMSGMGWEDHDSDCLSYIVNDLKSRFPDMDWPDVPGDYECGCEKTDFSHSQCEGCGSHLYGERHAMTLFGPASEV